MDKKENQIIDKLNKQELEPKQDTISYQREPCGDGSYIYTYKIGNGQNTRFIEASKIFGTTSSRADIKFKDNNGTILYLCNTCDGYGSIDMGKALVGQLSWEKPEMIHDFMRCIALIEKSDCPSADPLRDIMSYIRLEEVLRKEQRERPEVSYRIDFGPIGDCFLEVTNEDANRQIALYGDKKDFIFSVKSVKNEEDAAKEIVNLLPNLTKRDKELRKKIKEKLSAIQGNTFVDKLLQKIQEKEEKEEKKVKNKLATLRNKVAKVADKIAEATGTEKIVQKFTDGKKITDVEISAEKKAWEKKFSDKFFGKVNE